jgi:hypothetical protein
MDKTFRHVTGQSRINCDGVARELQYRLCSLGEYPRLNVDRGLENIKLNDW